MGALKCWKENNIFAVTYNIASGLDKADQENIIEILKKILELSETVQFAQSLEGRENVDTENVMQLFECNKDD